MYEAKQKTKQFPEGHQTDKWVLLQGRDIYDKLFTDIVREIQNHVMENSKSL